MFLSGCTIWAFLCSASVKAPLCLGNSAPERRPITVQPRGTRAKWMSACLCHDGWASLERWWMTKVAMFVSYHAEWVTMAILLLQWPLLDLCQKDKSAMTLAACWMTDSSRQSRNTLMFDRGKVFAKVLKMCSFSKATPTCNWLWTNVCFLLFSTNSNK